MIWLIVGAGLWIVTMFGLWMLVHGGNRKPTPKVPKLLDKEFEILELEKLWRSR